MAKTVAFGIGCFHFGIKKKAPFDFQGEWYLQELEKAFRSIASVENFSLNGQQQLRDDAYRIEEDPRPIGDGPNYRPYWHNMGIELDLHIPQRVQSELTSKAGRIETFTERFKVHIYQEYYSPLAIVELIEPSGAPSPSDGVIVVRELLVREFEKMTDTQLRFDVLGPSPFHADFFVELAEDARADFESGFGLVRDRSPGYDVLTFYADSTVFDGIEDAKEAVYAVLSRELGVFYWLAQIRAGEMEEWEAVEDATRRLVSSESPEGKWDALVRFAKARGLIANAYRSLLEYEGLVIENDDDCYRRIAELYESGEKGWLQEDVLRASKERYKRPVQQRMTFVTFVESRRVQRGQNFVVLVSAILGGAVGSILTLILARR